MQCHQWYYASLRAGKHYIAVDEQHSTLRSGLDSLVFNDSLTAAIGTNGQHLAKRLTYAHEVEHTAAMLRQLFMLNQQPAHEAVSAESSMLSRARGIAVISATYATVESKGGLRRKCINSYL